MPDLEKMRSTEELVSRCGGWIRLSVLAWQKYVRRKRHKRLVDEARRDDVGPQAACFADPHQATVEPINLSTTLVPSQATREPDYVVHEITTRRVRSSRAPRRRQRTLPQKSVRSEWLVTKEARKNAAADALQTFPDLRVLDVACTAWHSLLAQYPCVFCVEFYLWRSRTSEPAVAVDP